MLATLIKPPRHLERVTKRMTLEASHNLRRLPRIILAYPMETQMKTRRKKAHSLSPWTVPLHRLTAIELTVQPTTYLSFKSLND